jgi:hypothetical protein
MAIMIMINIVCLELPRMMGMTVSACKSLEGYHPTMICKVISKPLSELSFSTYNEHIKRG